MELPTPVVGPQTKTEQCSEEPVGGANWLQSFVWHNSPSNDGGRPSPNPCRANAPDRQGTGRRDSRTLSCRTVERDNSTGPSTSQVPAPEQEGGTRKSLGCKSSDARHKARRGTEEQKAASGRSERKGVSGHKGGDVSCCGPLQRGDVVGGNRGVSRNDGSNYKGLGTEDKEVVIKRLGDAAVAFWPNMSFEERHDRVYNTLAEIISREKKGEFHSISWWAKHMWGRSLTLLQRRREVPFDNLEVWAAIQHANQDRVVAACEALSLLKLLPEKHRAVVLLKAEGANPVEIAEELKKPVTTILAMLKDARHWLEDGGAYLYRREIDGERIRTGASGSIAPPTQNAE